MQLKIIVEENGRNRDLQVKRHTNATKITIEENGRYSYRFKRFASDHEEFEVCIRTLMKCKGAAGIWVCAVL
ncbi:hypothetical protein ACQJBY_014702 [Aegilops geniculata]